jgi:hypothetical protein
LQCTASVASKAKALDFINKDGFVTLFPIKGKSLPSLYQAIIGNREEKFNNAFEWADELSVKERKIYYGKLVEGQITLISMDALPYFYKLYKREEFTGTPAKIYAFIKQNGATSTSDLRKGLDLAGPSKKSEFVKALDLLQMSFAIAVVNKGKPPRHTHTYDVIENWIPKELLRKAETISAEEARAKIIAKLVENHVVSSTEDAEALLKLRS